MKLIKLTLLIILFNTFNGISQCNTDNSVCSGGQSASFGFAPPSTNPSSCLAFTNQNGANYGYIILYITATGPLNLLINSPLTTGYLDVAIFDITGQANPCASLSLTTEIGCNYATNASGCNQFGTTFPCASSVPSPNVTAGDVLMILVEDWSNAAGSFTLQLDNGPGSAQTGPGNATISAVPLLSTAGPSATMTAADGGGTWSADCGVCIDPLTGIFDPSVSGAGTFQVCYDLGVIPCDAQDCYNVVVDAPCVFTGISANQNISCPSITYTTTGVLTFNDPPPTGNLTVTDCNGNNQVFNAPFVSPINYIITGQNADGGACDVTAVFSDEAVCTNVFNYTAPICPCNITNFTTTQSVCNPVSNTYIASGVISFDMPPSTGILTITVNNGTTTFDTIINAADFSSPLAYSISGIDSDASNSTITAVFSADGGCTSAQAYSAPIDCACHADAGSANPVMSGDGNSNFTLCFGDDFTYTSNSDYVGPTNVNIGTFTPGIGYAVYSCPPTVGMEPNSDACFEGVISAGTGNFALNDANDLSTLNSYPGGTFTNNTIYYVPLTMYNVNTLTYSVSTPPCYDLGIPIAVQYLPEIKSLNVEDCQNGSISSTITGGLPQIDGSNFTVVGGSLTPANASFGNTTTTNGGTITINGLTNGQNYSYNITDINGCPTTISGTFNGIEDASFSYNNTTICQAGTNPTITITGDVGVFSFTAVPSAAVLSLNTTTGAINVSTSDPGVYNITYTTNDAICFSTSSISMTIEETPIINAISDQTICNTLGFTAINFSGTIGSTYNWTNSNTTIGIVGNGTGNISAFNGTNSTSAQITSSITVTSTLGTCIGSPTTFDLIVNPTPIVNAGTNQTICEPLAVTLTATNPNGATITWDNTISDGTAFNPVVGTLTYTVTAVLSGCIATDDVDVTVNPLPTINAGTDITVCQNDNAILTATNPNGASLVWDNGILDNFQFFPTLGTTIYTVTATLNGCVSTDNVNVIVNQTPTYTVTETSPTTCGGIDGFVTINGLSNSTIYQITYNDGGIQGPTAMTSNGSGEIAITGLLAGSYTDFLVDLLTCTTSNNTVLNLVDPSAPIVNAGIDQTICENDNVTLTATNPSGATLTWNNTVVDGTAFTPAVGTITYTVTANLADCISIDVVDVIVNPLPTINAGIDQTVCENDNVTLTATNPNNANLAWNNGVTDGTTFVSPVGTITYTVTATLLTCVSTDDVDVIVNPLPSFTIAGTDPTTCGGIDGFITISGLANSTSYQISYNNGTVQGPNTMTSDATGNIILVGLNAGNYTNFIVDALTCATTDYSIINLVDPSAPIVNAGNNQTICENDNVTLTATNPSGATLIWDNGITNGGTFTPGVGTMTYTVTANLLGCISTDIVDVTVNPLPSINAGIDQTICENDNVTLTATNPDGANLVWDNGITDGTGFISPVGTITYTVTATLLTCVSTDDVDVIVNPLPTFSVTGTDPTTCGGTDGFVTISGLLNSTNYQISYNDGAIQGPNAMTSDATGNIILTGLNAGNYSDFTVDALTCTTTDNTIINLIDPSAPMINAGNNQVICENDNVTLTATNPSNATITWDNGITEANPFTPAVGTLTYTVTANLLGCISTDVVDVTVNPLPSINAGIDQTICENDNVTLTATNPDGANLIWANGVTDGTAFVSPVGIITYTITATLLTCVSTDDVDVIVNPLPTFSVAGTDPTTCNGTDGFVTISGLLNLTNYQISYNNGAVQGPNAMTSDATGNIILTGLNAGNYTDFTVDALTCVTIDNTTINLVDPSAPMVNAGTDQTICDPLAVTLTATNPNGAVITWDNGVTNGTSFNPVIGTITYTVTANLAGCISTDDVDVTVNPLPLINAGVDITTCENDNITLTGNNPNSAMLTWDNSVTNGTPFISPVGTTIYTVSATLLTCVSTDDVIVIVNPLPTFTVTGTDPTTCGGTDGFVTISGLLNSTNYQISYNDGTVQGPTSMTSDPSGNIILTGLNAGSYSDFSIDALTCVTLDNTTINLVDPSAPMVNAGTDQTICEPLAVTLIATNPNNAIITWDNGISNGTAFNPLVGTTTYTVTANLANCISTDAVDVIVNPLPTINATADQTLCDTDNLILTATNPDGANLTWDNGITDATLFTPTIGTTTYTVTATLLGCVSTDAIDILVNPLGNPGYNYLATSYCTSENNPIPTIDVMGGSFSFTSVGGGLLSINPTTGEINLVASTPDTYSITYTTVGPCVQDSTIIVNIALTPIVNAITDQTVCHNSYFSPININGSAGSTFSWTNDNPSINMLATGNGSIPSFLGLNTTLIPQIANIIVTPSAGSCTGQPTFFNLTVNTLDDNGFDYTTAPYCTTDNNPTPTINVSGGIFTSFTTIGTGTIDLDIATGEINLLNSSAGSFDITYATTGADCPQDSTLNITINPTPTVDNITNQTVCNGFQFSIIDFTGNSNPTYNWVNDNSNIGLPLNGSGDILPFTASIAGGAEMANITVTPLTTMCTGLPTTFVLSVNPLDNPTFTYPTYTYCNTELTNPITTISVTGGIFSYTVISGGTHLTINSTTGEIDLNASDEGVYEITYTTAGPCVQTSTQTITINFTPTINTLSNQAICPDGSTFSTVTFSGTNGLLPTNYNWTNNMPSIGLSTSGSGNIASFAGINTTTSPVTATIIVTPNTSECIGTPTTFNLIVNELDDPSFQYDQGLTFCATGQTNPTVTITGTTGGLFSYSVVSGGPNLVFDISNGGIDLSSSDVGSYAITYDTPGVCDQTSTLTVVITSIPIADFTMGNTNLYCANAADPSPIYQNGGSGSLFTATPLGLNINSLTGLVDIDASPPGIYTITNTIDLLSDGCISVDHKDIITIFELPTAFISGSNTICPLGNLSQLNIEIHFTSTGPWDVIYTQNGNTMNANGMTPYIFSPTQFGSYNLVSVIDANGCTNSAIGQVLIDSFPTPRVHPLNDYFGCEGSDVFIHDFGGYEMNDTFIWSISSGTDIGFGMNGTSTAINSITAPGIGTFTATNSQTVTVDVYPVSNNGCTGSTIDFDVTIYPTPIVLFNADTLLGCNPTEVTFVNQTILGTVYEWNFGDGTEGNGISTSHTYSTSGLFDVALTVTTTEGCSSTDTTFSYVSITDTPIADFVLTPQYTDVNHSEIEFTNQSEFGEEYEWNFGDYSALNYEENPIYTYERIEGHYPISLLVTNNNGVCRDSIIKYIKINEILVYFVPNVFTPEEDNYNNTFKPIFTSGFEADDYRLTIYNRWGELVFQSENHEIGWEGNYTLNGDVCQDGIYIWRIQFKENTSDKRQVIEGHVTLLK